MSDRLTAQLAAQETIQQAMLHKGPLWVAGAVTEQVEREQQKARSEAREVVEKNRDAARLVRSEIPADVVGGRPRNEIQPLSDPQAGLVRLMAREEVEVDLLRERVRELRLQNDRTEQALEQERRQPANVPRSREP